MTIKARFSLLFIGNTIVVLGLFSATYSIVERRAAIREQQQEQTGAVEKLAAACQSIDLSASALPALKYLNVVKNDPALVYAACLDGKGKVQAHTDSTWLGRQWPDDEDISRLNLAVPEKMSTRDSQGTALLKWYSPVRPVGLASIVYRENALRAAVRRRISDNIRQTLWVAGVTFLVSLLLSLLIAWSVSRPIMNLMDAARAIGGGDLEFKTPVAERKDELGALAREMNSMAARLKELDQMKEEFISLVSHDLRSPLSAIRMHVDYLISEIRGPLNEKQKEMLQVCIDAVNRLHGFIANVLDAAKMRSGKMEYQFEQFKLSEAIAPVIELQKIALEKTELNIELPDLSAAPQVFGDKEKIEHVFANLISNAIKHTPNGGRIAVRWQSNGTPGFVKVSVENTGKPIPKDQLGHLFRKFEQVDLKKQKELGIRGTGFGLFVVKRMVEAHRGTVTVDSDPNQPVRFHFTLPADRGAFERSSHEA